LKKYDVRDRVKIIASGMLATADKMAIALCLGADLVNIARAAMNTIGCINSQNCQKNTCPVGITTHNPHLEKGLVVEEKRFRTANYLITMRQGLFMLGASCGIDSPTKFSREHVTYRDKNSTTNRMDKNSIS
jgi:glutamate synthase (ferredoxin)